MSSVKWVDLCASDSEVEGSSDDQATKNKPPVKQSSDIPSLQKALSSPEQSSKSIKYDNQAKINQNLQKLGSHKGSKVWLYINSDYSSNRQGQIGEILQNNKQFESILSSGKGWNVQIDTQLARKYLQKGYNQKGSNFRFFYSTKNENKDYSGRRIEKKYSEKYSEPRQQTRNPKLKLKQTYSQKSNYQRDREDQRGEKKKVKYVAKESIQKKEDEQKPKLEEIKQEKKGSEQLDNLTNSEVEKKVDQQPEINTFKQITQKHQNISQNLEQKQVEVKVQNGKKEEQQQCQQKNSEKQQADRKIKQKQREKQKQKEKNKKKKKNKGSSNSGFHDPNNPFSSFA